jgi:hypothetical protein
MLTLVGYYIFNVANNPTQPEKNMTKIDTTAYSRNFGRNPRPNDYGLWMFFLGCNGSTFTWNGTYKVAASLAKAEANKWGYTKISIAP